MKLKNELLETIAWWGQAFFLIYCFIVFFRNESEIWWLSTGIDHSWQYAISKAALEGFHFGTDIIFTFGTLGYLVSGSTLEENFYEIFNFRLLVHILFFGVFIWKLISIESKWKKLILLLTLLVSFLIELRTEYKLVFIFAILLSSNILEKRSRLRIILPILGIISGIGILTKFTLGVYLIGSLFLYLLGKSFLAIKYRNWLSLRSYCTSLIQFLLVSTSTSFLFSTPDFYKNLQELIYLNIGAVIAVVLYRSIQIYFQNNPVNTAILSWDWQTEIVFYGIYSFGLVSVLLKHPTLLKFIKGSLEISSGYSSAMTVVGSHLELALGIINLIFIFGLLVYFNIKNINNFPWTLSFTLIIWLSFKHAFVRQDGHILFFLNVALFLSTILILNAIDRISLRSSLFIYCCILTFALTHYIFPSPFNNPIYFESIAKTLSPSRVVQMTERMINPDRWLDLIRQNHQKFIARLELPQNFRDKIAESSVDIIPWEISLVEGNSLNWHPRPIFQSYSAYTSWLDLQNLNSFQNSPPQYILYNFVSLDRKHPFFFEPATFYEYFCNYKPDNGGSKTVDIGPILDLILLERRDKNICLPTFQEKHLTVNWDDTVILDKGSLQRAKVEIHYSLLGKLYKLLFRAAPVMIDVEYSNHDKHQYRISPDNAKNGLVISPLPRNTPEVIAMFQGDLSLSVRSFSLSTSNPILYDSQIQIELVSSEIDLVK
jgi:hypothetical protein